MTLSSSKTLAFVPLPRVPVNKFPRAVRANRPRSPKVGRTRPSPAFPPPWAPRPGGFHTSRAATARDRPGRAQVPALTRTTTPTALPAQPAPRGPSGPSGQADTRPQARPRPPGPLRTAPRPHHSLRARLGARGHRAARRPSPRLPQCSRLLLRRRPQLASRTSARAPGGAGSGAARAASERLRPERVPPSRRDRPHLPSPHPPPCRPRSQAPPRPPGSAHTAVPAWKGADRQEP